jgi:hypothetical protein
MSDPAARTSLPLPATRGAALNTALAALGALAELGETIEDEWSYVTALADAGRARLNAAAGPDLAAALAPDRAAAVVAACAEIALITDPHRAIDWLSTFPAVVELAFLAPAGSETVGPVAGSNAVGDAGIGAPAARPAPDPAAS